MNSVSHPWIACALAGLMLASGCGDDGGGTDTDSTTNGTTTNMTTPTTTDATTDDSSTGSAAMLSHAADIQPIWDANCVTGCHAAGGTGSAWFLLTDDVAYSSLVGAASTSFPALTLVVAGDSANSYLLHKLNNTQGDVGGGGSPMPQPAAMQAFMPLSDADLEKIETWIDQGAMP